MKIFSNIYQCKEKTMKYIQLISDSWHNQKLVSIDIFILLELYYKKIGDELKIVKKIVKEFIQKDLIEKDNRHYYLDEINYIEEHIKYIDKMKFYFDDNIDKIVDKASLEKNYITSNCYYKFITMTE